MSGLALGTAQFGLDYGIKNERGRVPEGEVAAILAAAREGGIDTIDTAAAYGSSESALRPALAAQPGAFRVVSKLPAAPERSAREELEASLGRLGVERLYAYLFHSFATYRSRPGLLDELAACKSAGLVEKIGFSLYLPEEAEQLLDAGLPFDLAQVPYNLFDRRFERVFPRLRERGVEIHVRSAFLQGLLLMEPARLDARFDAVRGRIEALRGAGSDSGLGLPALCLGFAARAPEVGRVVIGVDSLDDLRDNLAAFGRRAAAESVLDRLGDLSVADESIILPYNWKRA